MLILGSRLGYPIFITMKYTALLLFISFNCLFALGQNKQYLIKLDTGGIGSRVHNMFNSPDTSNFYPLTIQSDVNGIVNNGHYYYRLNKFNYTNGLQHTVELFKIGKPVAHIVNLNQNGQSLIVGIKIDTPDSFEPYIVYFDNELKVDSFKLNSKIKFGSPYTYLKYGDSLITIHGDDFTDGGNIYALITDTQGNYLSHKRIPYENGVSPPNIIEVSPRKILSDGKGGFIVVGSRDSAGTNFRKHLFGLDSAGNKTWEYLEPKIGNSIIANARLLPDGSLLAWGAHWPFMYMGNFSIKGELLWQKLYYPGTLIRDDLASISNVILVDGFFYAVGSGYDYVIDQTQKTDVAVLMKLTLQGEVIWAKRFANYYYNNILEHIALTGKDKFVLGGFCIDSTLTPIHGVAWYVHTDTAANELLPWCKLMPVETRLWHVGQQQLEQTPVVELQIFPNPVLDGSITVNVLAQLPIKNAQLTLYNQQGMPVYQNKQAGLSNTIHTQAFAAGYYYIEYKAGNTSVTKKVLIE